MASVASKNLNSKRPYVMLARDVLWEPPVAYRGNTDASRVTPFEFNVLVGVLDAAQAALGDAMHREAKEAAGKTIERELELHAAYRDKWDKANEARRRGERIKVPTREHAVDLHDVYAEVNDEYAVHNKKAATAWRPIRLRKALRATGSKSYKQVRRTLRGGRPDEVQVFVTRRALLRGAGLSCGGKSVRRLDAALERLCRPVGRMPSPIVELAEGEKGTLAITVDSKWFAPPFKKLPKPMPQSPAALSLYLLLYALDTGPVNREAMNERALFQRLGVSTARGVQAGIHTVNQALADVNEHLRSLPVAELHRLKVKCPAGFDVHDDNGYVRFVSVRHERDEEGELIFKRKVKRVRLVKRVKRVPLVLDDEALHARANFPTAEALGVDPREFHGVIGVDPRESVR